ncbi:MAG TPA: DUF3108 domain-containing protein [Anaeromyxobacteraceae bacterium]|nr:DUF3108 domain-containing protein [Anaeromyxobacteraceae bacterium]
MTLTTTIAATALAVIALQAPPAAALQPGEEIRMSVSYLHLPSGEGTISIGEPDNGAWPLVFQGKTGGFVGLVNVRERLVSWWDPQSRLPFGSNLSAQELGDKHDDEARFDRGSLKATVTVSRKGKVRTREVDVPADALDLPSVFMYLRLQPLAVGERYSVPVLAGRDLFTLDAEVVKAERLDTDIGEVDAVAVRIRTGFKGKFDSKRPTWLWFTADERHVPLRITAEFAVGSLVASIKSYRPGGELAVR